MILYLYIVFVVAFYYILNGFHKKGTESHAVMPLNHKQANNKQY